jgi:hypothetical protein
MPRARLKVKPLKGHRTPQQAVPTQSPRTA